MPSFKYRIKFNDGIVGSKGHNRHHNIGRRQNKGYQSKVGVTNKIGKQKEDIDGSNSKSYIGNDGIFYGLRSYNTH